MKKQAMSVLVKYLDVPELNELKKTFVALDVTKTGTLTPAEIEEALRLVGI
jgi:Ca2+-binding EF-hand superfamily protein